MNEGTTNSMEIAVIRDDHSIADENGDRSSSGSATTVSFAQKPYLAK
jgi:hypothetical protein